MNLSRNYEIDIEIQTKNEKRRKKNLFQDVNAVTNVLKGVEEEDFDDKAKTTKIRTKIIPFTAMKTESYNQPTLLNCIFNKFYLNVFHRFAQY